MGGRQGEAEGREHTDGAGVNQGFRPGTDKLLTG